MRKGISQSLVEKGEDFYLNSQHKGMRKALELAEESLSKVNVGDLQLTNWGFAVEANEKLYDFPMTFTTEEALRVVEPYVGEGFEAWRQLRLRYSSTGGATEIDRTVRLFTKKACKNMAATRSIKNSNAMKN